MSALIVGNLFQVACSSKGQATDLEFVNWMKDAQLSVCALGPIIIQAPGDQDLTLQVPLGYRNSPVVSPDGRSIAWIPWPTVFARSLDVRHVDDSGVHEVSAILPHDYTEVVESTISSRGVLVTVFYTGSSLSVVAVTLRIPGTIEVFPGLLEDIGRYDLERLSISSDGQFLACGTRDRSILLHLATKQRVFDVSGRFPTVSPDGQLFAWVGREGDLNCKAISGINSRQDMAGRILGLGSVSPDGRYLLAGQRKVVGQSLCVIDVKSFESVATLAALGEGNYGQAARWISNKLLA